MFFLQEARIDKMIVHRVGNKAREESCFFSEHVTPMSDDILSDLLRAYFTAPFKVEDYHHFYHPDDIEFNAVFTYARTLFQNSDSFYDVSVKLAKHLFEQSLHPNIKSGELYVVLMDGVVVDGNETQAIGIFKSENKDTFLKINVMGSALTLGAEEGININKLDKGCIIFNLDEESGYNALVVDMTARDGEAVFWKDSFLKVMESKTSFSQTTQFVRFASNFIQHDMPEHFELDRADQVALLNRTQEFLKSKDLFKMDEYAEEIIQQPEVVERFKTFQKLYEDSRDFTFDDELEVNEVALKKNARAFKSIIKLDKNFHIYIHGNRDLVKKGEDEQTGMKYYQLYYREEL